MNEQKAERADAEFRQWFDTILPQMRDRSQRIIGMGEEHIPVLVAFTGERGKGAAAVVPIHHLDKEHIAAMHRAIASTHVTDVYASVLVMEAWYLDVSKEARVPEGSLKDVPGRKECLMINAIHRSQQLVAMYSIERPSNTLSAEPLSVVDPTGDTGATGRFVINRQTEH